MKPEQNPPPLWDDPEVGEVMRALAEDGVEPGTMAVTVASIERAAAAGKGASSALGGVSAAKVGLAAVALVGAGLGWHYLTSAPSSTPSAERAPASTTRQPSPAAVRPARAPAAPKDVAAADTAPQDSGLGAQLQLLLQAREQAKARRFDRAIGGVDRLLSRYPKSPLRAEALLSRADYLVRAGRAADAVPALRSLAADPQHTGRSAELWRVLGDQLRGLDRCREARAAYRRAVALGGKSDQARAARRGLKLCASRTGEAQQTTHRRSAR